MQVKIRLQRFGNKKRPYYRIVAASSSKQRDGRFLEILGLYHPIAAEEKQYRLEKERILDWLSKGAQPTETVKKILSKNNIWQDFAIAKEKKRVDRVKKKRLSRKNKSNSDSKTEKIVSKEE